MKQNEKQNSKKTKRKHKNGIWFNNTDSIEYYAEAKAEKLEKILENIIFYGITIPLQLVQSAGVFVIAYFNNAFAELSFFLVGFFFTRTFLGETFHLNSTLKCTLFTWTVFFLITAFIPSIEISVFLCVILGALMATYMNYIVVKDEKNGEKII